MVDSSRPHMQKINSKMEVAPELPRPACLTAPQTQDLPKRPGSCDYISPRFASEPLPAAYRLLDQAKQSLEKLRNEAAGLHESLHSVGNDLQLLVRKEDSEIGAEMSLLSATADIDGLFTQVKKAVFVVDAQIESFCFKHKSAYSEKERKKAVTSALEKMANDIWAALIAAVHNKSPKAQLAETRQTISTLRIRADALAKGLTASLESIEEVLFGYLKGGVLTDCFDPVWSGSSQGEVGVLHSGKEELAAELQEEGLRMLASFEQYASVRGGRSTSVTAVRREMNRILKDMVATVQLHCAGCGPQADVETWKMKKQAVRIKTRIASLCKDLAERQAAALWENSMESVPTCHLGRDTSSFEAGRSTLSFDSPDRNIHSRCPSTEPSYLPTQQPRTTRSRSERVRCAVTQVHARQESMNVDIEEIRGKLSNLFPASRLHASTLPALALLKTLAPQLAACGDHEFIELFAQQVRTERQEEANFLATLRDADLQVLSVKAAGEEFVRLKESLHCLRAEYADYRGKTTEYLKGSERDKALLEQLEKELKQLRDRREYVVSAATQTGPIALCVETVITASCLSTKETPEISDIPGSATLKRSKSADKERPSPVKTTSRPLIPRKLTTVQEVVECMEHEEEPRSARSELPHTDPTSPLIESPKTPITPQLQTTGGKTLLRLPMSYFKAMSKDSGTLSAGKLPSKPDLVEKRTIPAKSQVAESVGTELRRKALVLPSNERLNKGILLASALSDKSAASKSVTPPRKKTQTASPREKSLTAWSVSELKGKKVVIREPVLRRNESRASRKSAPKQSAQEQEEIPSAENSALLGRSLSIPLEATVPSNSTVNAAISPVSNPTEISDLHQLVSAKVEELQRIAEEEAALEAERATTSFAALEEQYIEAKLVEWAAFPDLFRLGRWSQDLCRVHRRFEQVFGEIQSLNAEIQACQTSLSLLPVPVLWTAPGQVCGRVRFEAWEWTLVRLEGVCIWVRCGVAVASLYSTEMVEKYLEGAQLMLGADLVQALTRLLNLLPNTSL